MRSGIINITCKEVIVKAFLIMQKLFIIISISDINRQKVGIAIKLKS